MVISTLTDRVGAAVSETFFEPVIRLGVTGLSRAGKTVFITSLVANLLDRGRMPGLQAAADDRIAMAYLQPQPNDTVPRFDYETHLGQLLSSDPAWPDSTRSVSELRISLRVRPTGLMGTLRGARTVHLDIVDYPGEWLLDVSLLDKDYATWSADALGRVEKWDGGAPFRAAISGLDGTQPHDEPTAKLLAEAYTDALHAARAKGAYDCSPGRFLLPGDLAGSPALTFVPLPEGGMPRGSLRREMARRFEAYKSQVVRPFFERHFRQIDRQVVLVDALGAISSGPQAVEEMRAAMADILAAFNPGRNGFLSALLGKRVEKILFAATKADHIHHRQHPQMTAIMEALMREARDRADFAGAETKGMAIASIRATTEDIKTHQRRELAVVQGTLLSTGKQAAFYPGRLPEDPNRLLVPAREGAERWLDADYKVMRFAPAALTLKPGEGPPHIRLDQAAEFLLGDRL